jgi:hypothetical protein
MAEMEKVEFEFPDEKEEKESRKGSRVVTPEPEEKVEVAQEEDFEVVDDTPEEDRGRKPMENPPEDPTDEELATYSKREKTKTREFHKAYHDERRAKEAAMREKEEAIRIAQAILEENNRLKGTVNQSQNALLEQAKRTVAQELEDAKRKYKQAYENGDSDALVAAQEEITSAKIKADRVNNFKPKPLQEEKNQVQMPEPQVRVDPKAENWRRANEWFGVDREMTGFALAVHDKLVSEEGLSPQSDEYYQRIDGRLRQVFPEKFASAKPADANQRPNANVVASASRSVAPKKITLTASEVNIAKRLNIPLERYAREVAVLRRNNNG